MPAGPYAPFSLVTVLELLGVIGLSGATFWLLVRRATSHRRWVAIADWGREKGFRHRKLANTAPPAPFSSIKALPPQVRLWLTGKKSQILQLQPRDGSKTWHVLIRQIESNWPPTALRPTKTDDTLLELFSLASYPSMIASERFAIFGAESSAAKTVAASSLPALLPPDIGLLLHGRSLVFDFSSRPFDTIEFDRMIALANHIVGHLPGVTKSN